MFSLQRHEEKSKAVSAVLPTKQELDYDNYSGISKNKLLWAVQYRF